MSNLRIGVALWSQSSDWSDYLDAARRVDRLGYDHLWTWDHIYAIFGDENQSIFEGYTALAAMAQATERICLGLFVGANTFRNPGLATKALITIDHISGGRAIMGVGGAWFEREHTAYGIDFGSGFGQRLDWLGEAVPAMRTLLDGGVVSSDGGRYAFDGLRMTPRPLQDHLPLMIGGSGEKKTLPLVARYADIWNAFGTPETLRRKDDILRSYCSDFGTDADAIIRSVGCKVTVRQSEAEAHAALEGILDRNDLTTSAIADDHTFWTGTPEQIAEKMISYRAVGFHDFIVECPSPYDTETLETIITEVKPMVEAA